MKRNLLAVVLISLSLLFMSCTKDSEVVKEKEEPEKPTEPVKPPIDPPVVWSSDRAKNLNIVYFVPSDLDTLPLYQKRLSELFIWTQNRSSTGLKL